jgi:hypothetical protein
MVVVTLGVLNNLADSACKKEGGTVLRVLNIETSLSG